MHLIKLGRHVNHGEKMNPIDFEGQGHYGYHRQMCGCMGMLRFTLSGFQYRMIGYLVTSLDQFLCLLVTTSIFHYWLFNEWPWLYCQSISTRYKTFIRWNTQYYVILHLLHLWNGFDQWETKPEHRFNIYSNSIIGYPVNNLDLWLTDLLWYTPSLLLRPRLHLSMIKDYHFLMIGK